MDNIFIRPKVSQIRDQVYEAILDAIIELTLKPGQRLTEAQLSQQLGVSKTPIREALVRLQEMGLVATESYKGAIVTGYDTDDLREVYEIRELLQGSCARQAAISMPNNELEQLHSIVESSWDLDAGHDTNVVRQFFDEFDLIINRQSRNHRISELLATLQYHMIRIGKLTVTIPGRIEASLRQHEQIFKAIQAGDPEAAEKRMRDHVRSVLGDHLASKSSVEGLRSHASTEPSELLRKSMREVQR